MCIGLGVWCLMALSTILQLCCGCQVYWLRKPKYKQIDLEKTSDLLQVTDKLYHIILNGVRFTMSEIRTHNISGDRSK